MHTAVGWLKMMITVRVIEPGNVISAVYSFSEVCNSSSLITSDIDALQTRESLGMHCGAFLVTIMVGNAEVIRNYGNLMDKMHEVLDYFA